MPFLLPQAAALDRPGQGAPLITGDDGALIAQLVGLNRGANAQAARAALDAGMRCVAASPGAGKQQRGPRGVPGWQAADDETLMALLGAAGAAMATSQQDRQLRSNVPAFLFDGSARW